MNVRQKIVKKHLSGKRTAYAGDNGQKDRKNSESVQGVKMKIAYPIGIAAVFCLCAFSAQAYPFSFNKADAARMVDACKDDGIRIPEKLAQAIVDYREANGPFKTAEDLLKVPGFNQLYFNQLEPIEEDDDVRFNLSDIPGLPGY